MALSPVHGDYANQNCKLLVISQGQQAYDSGVAATADLNNKSMMSSQNINQGECSQFLHIPFLEGSFFHK
jgi:hypothetical protein